MDISTLFIRRRLAAVALGMLTTVPAWAVSADMNKPRVVHAMGQTILEMPLADGVSLADAIGSLKLRANMLNVEQVGKLHVSKGISAVTGKPERLITIYEFCEPMVAKRMLDLSPAFAAFMPCRITLIEGKDGHGVLVMQDLGSMIKAAHLPPRLKHMAVDISDKMLSIMEAGADGDL